MLDGIDDIRSACSARLLRDIEEGKEKGIIHRMRSVERAWHFARTHWGMEDLKRQADRFLDQPEELVSLIFKCNHPTLRPYQNKEELTALVRDVRALRPQTVLEIGTAQGGTLFLWTRLAQADAVIVSLDLPGGRFGGGYPDRKSVV